MRQRWSLEVWWLAPGGVPSGLTASAWCGNWLEEYNDRSMVTSLGAYWFSHVICNFMVNGTFERPACMAALTKAVLKLLLLHAQ